MQTHNGFAATRWHVILFANLNLVKQEPFELYSHLQHEWQCQVSTGGIKQRRPCAMYFCWCPPLIGFECATWPYLNNSKVVAGHKALAKGICCIAAGKHHCPGVTSRTQVLGNSQAAQVLVWKPQHFRWCATFPFLHFQSPIFPAGQVLVVCLLHCHPYKKQVCFDVSCPPCDTLESVR